jgi:hypothetical protein
MAARRHDRMPDRYPVHVRSSPVWLVLGRGACLPRAGTIDSGATGSEDAAMEQPFHEGQKIWVEQTDGSQREAIFVGEAELSSWFGGGPGVYVVYPDTRSGEEVAAARIVPRDG